MAEKKKSRAAIITNGILKDNPVLIQLLGTCPALAVTTMAVNGLGMGAATTFVLICSNIVLAMLRNVIPNRVRIPCYIVVIAGFVTIVQMLVQAYAPAVNDSLGIFLPLIVVNCIILGRAEMFASKNSVVNSALDGLGMGLGFTFALILMGSIREILGSGTWFGMIITANAIDPMIIFLLAPGGFFVYGVIIAAVNYFSKGKAIKRKSMGCENCPSAAVCGAMKCPPDPDKAGIKEVEA